MRVMIKLSILLLCLLSLDALPAGPSRVQNKNTAERLGYPSDAKLLVIHADDVGLAHSVNLATFRALEKKAVSCGSIMVPCPWLSEVADYCKSHPDVDLGIHLTLTSEWKNYRWGPVSNQGSGAGLLDPGGYLWPAVLPVTKNARATDIEAEIRAQIERALKAGIRPTHLDSHMGTLFTPAFFQIYVKVAREYGMPFFAVRVPGALAAMVSLLKESDVVPDTVVMANESVKPERWREYYIGIVNSLKPGLTEMIVHLAQDDAEMQAIAEGHPAFGSAWRQRDYDVLTSPEFLKALKDNNVTLIGWKEIGKVWN